MTLRNRGSEAYKPESFGDRIVVERQIKRDGSGVYKLKGAKGTMLACIPSNRGDEVHPPPEISKSIIIF